MDLGRNKVISRASKFKNHEVISLKNVNEKTTINFINILTFRRKLFAKLQIRSTEWKYMM